MEAGIDLVITNNSFFYHIAFPSSGAAFLFIFFLTTNHGSKFSCSDNK